MLLDLTLGTPESIFSKTDITILSLLSRFLNRNLSAYNYNSGCIRMILAHFLYFCEEFIFYTIKLSMLKCSKQMDSLRIAYSKI